MACQWIWMRRLGLLYFTISESGYNGQRGGVIRSAEHRIVLLNFAMEPEKMTVWERVVEGNWVDVVGGRIFNFKIYHFGKRVQWATWRCNQIRGAPRSFVKFRDGT